MKCARVSGQTKRGNFVLHVNLGPVLVSAFMEDQETADSLLATTRDGLMALGYTGGLLRFDYRFARVTSPGATVDRMGVLQT